MSRHSLLAPLAILAGAITTAPSASQAFEAFDGRLQAHGYFEVQLRGISKNYSDTFDMTQWYNVFNLELEVDIAPDGVGPIDLLSGYVRAEVRYDCIYSHGCGILNGVNVYGDTAQSLPRRLNNATRNVTTGALLLTERTRRNAFTTKDDKDRRATDWEGGADGREHIRTGSKILPSRDPAPLKQVPPFDALTLPGIDGYFGKPPTLQQDIFFRPQDADSTGELPGENVLLLDDASDYVFKNYLHFQGTAIDRLGGGGGGNPTDAMIPWRPRDYAGPNALTADRLNPFDKSVASPTVQAVAYNSQMFINTGYDPADFDTLDPDTYFENVAFEASKNIFFPNGSPATVQAWKDGFDFPAGVHHLGAREARDMARNGCPIAVLTAGSPCSPASPLRPIPTLEAGSDLQATGYRAQGMFLPSRPLREALASGRLDDAEFARDYRFSESDRSWNRGSSQRQTRELKEAYLDIELLDSNLWLRVGKQTIVWGKTELFRTTDQFNPQDLGLASLPSLEESRVALWAVRGVYSFYDLGPLEDVRLELAFNYDEFRTLDIGVCGEPYALNQACQLSLGSISHGTTAIGIAGVDTPKNPWEGIEGWEGGARIEFRTGRFSFAIADFYGFNDFPYIELLTRYDRNVDPASGRPRTIGSTGPCVLGNEPSCLTGGPVDFTDSATNDALLSDPRNSLESHHANQQLYTAICGSTVGFISLDATACSLGFFGSSAPLPIISPTLGQFTSALLAGSVQARILLGDTTGAQLPLVTLSADPDDEKNTNFQGETAPCMVNDPRGRARPCSGNGGGFASLKRQTLGQTLSIEQEALLGCGAFFGTHCDLNGIDLLNAEGSVLFQSFVGFEGTTERRPCQASLADCWRTDSTLPQPGTVGFHTGKLASSDALNRQGGPVATRFSFDANADKRTIILPGARRFSDDGFDVRVDGCVRQFFGYCASFTGGEVNTNPGDRNFGVRAFFHPFALDANGDRQLFASELGAASWNLLMFLAGNDAQFDPDNPMEAGKCSFLTPQLCDSVRAILGVAGPTRNIVEAGGNGVFGRRSFTWHGGGEAVLAYKKRNVLGVSVDFAEDYTQTSWSMEFAWIGKRPISDNLSPTGTVDVQDFNLAVGIDRPTFINFLNQGRTFFFNTQFFFQYRDGFTKGQTAGTGPFNFLFTALASTGYFHDRLLPAAIIVYDVRSNSGSVIPQITYRYSSNLRITAGLAFFFGEDQFFDDAVAPIAPGSNQFGPHSYQTAVQNGLGVLRDRDEAFIRIRYTF